MLFAVLVSCVGAGVVVADQILWYPDQTANPPINETQTSWNDVQNWTLYSDFTQVPPIPEIGPVPGAADDVIFSGTALLSQPPAQAQFTTTYAVLGDFIKQTSLGNVPYPANPTGTTVKTVTVNSGGFTFDFNAILPPGNNTLPGNTSGLTVTGDTGFQVGSTGFGGGGGATLTVTGHGTLSTQDAQIGIGVGVNGSITLTGNQTTWTDAGGAAGGVVIGNSFTGDPSGGTGTVNINSGATFNANAGLTVGNTGNGTLNVTGSTASAAFMLISGSTSSTSNASISGGSTFSCPGVLVVGYGGPGSLTVSGTGSTFTSGNDVRIGNSAGSSGSLTVQQSGSMSVAGTLGIGVAGQGTLMLTGPATLMVSGDTIIGNSAGSNGTATVQQGATMSATGGMGVGFGGPGSLTITGTGSMANVSGSVVVGNNSAGLCSVSIQQGAHMNVDIGAATANLTFDLGFASGSTTQLTVSGSGSQLNTTGLGQGPGTTTVSVTGGGAIAANVFEIGATAGDSGQATISGTNSNVTVTLGSVTQANGFFGIGQNGQGTLSISSGGTASAPFVLIGEHPGGIGTITVGGTGSNLQTTQIMSVGTGYVPSQGLDLGPAGGTGTLQVNSGGTVRVTQQLAMGNGGAVNLSGTGVMLVGGGSLPSASSTLLIATGGVLSGTGTISANVAYTSSTSSTYSGAIVDASGGGVHTLSLSGAAATLSLAGANTFTGGTTIGAGILSINADAALGAVPAIAATNITFNGSAGGTFRMATGFSGGTIAANRGITVNAGSSGTIDTNSNSVTWGGLLTNNGSFTKAGAGVLQIGRLNLGNGSTNAVNTGTLRLNVSSPSTIGTSVSANVAGGATLELAGAISALSNSTNRVNISNSSSAPGLLVSGTNQQVGAIDGTGTTQVNAGSNLTANHIIQGALVIGGTAVSHGTVAIAPSNSNGMSLASPGSEEQSALLSPADPAIFAALRPANPPPLAALTSLVSTASIDLLNPVQLTGLSPTFSAAAVPEPAAISLALFGIMALAWRRGRQLPKPL